MQVRLVHESRFVFSEVGDTALAASMIVLGNSTYSLPPDVLKPGHGHTTM